MKTAAVVLSLFLCSELAAQEWDVERSATDDATRLEFVATEGTWMSVDVSPDGKHIVFDLLGHLYEMPIGGGEAKPLTQGRSWNMFPRYSPDGRSIAFTSDRGGVDNIWTLDRASGRLDRLSNEIAPVFRASWSDDGVTLYAGALVDGTLLSKAQKIKLGGAVTDLPVAKSGTPINQFSEDASRGRVLFEHNDEKLYESGARIKAYDKRTAEVSVFIERPGGAFNPVVSPDGLSLAYLSRDDRKTRLIIRDLQTQQERVLTDALDPDRQDFKNYIHGAYSNMAWHPDNRELVVSFGGKIQVLDIATGVARVVRFRAPVKRDLDRALQFSTPIPEGKSRSRTHRWAQRTSKGILYETLGDLYLKTGTVARNLTASAAHEISPVYDARTGTLYYASWTDDDLGAVFARKLTGGQPRKLTSRPAQYGALALSPGGKNLLCLRGNAGLRSGYQQIDEELEFELIVLRADGKERHVTDIRWREGISAGSYPPPALSFDAAGNIYFTEWSDDTLLLRRVSLQGGEKTTLYQFPQATYATLSPDARWVLFQENHRSYVLPFSYAGKPVTASGSSQDARRLDAAHDGFFHTWQDAQTLQWTRGKEFREKSLSEVLQGRSNTRSTDLSVSFDVDSSASTVALRGVRVITMRTADEVLDDATVVIEGNRIRAVGNNVAVPANAKVFDLPGRTIMPGIIDVHAHPGHYRHGPGLLNLIEQRPNGHVGELAHGVTTMYEVAGTTLSDFWLSDMTLKGDITGPRFYSVGDVMLGFKDSRFKPAFRVIDSLEDAHEHVAINKDHGATGLKDYVISPRRHRHRMMTAAKQLGLIVFMEPGGTAATNFARLVDGYTNIAHGRGITTVYDDVIRFLAASGAGITPTLLISLDVKGKSLFIAEERLWENEKLLRFSSRDRLLAFRRGEHAWKDDGYPMQLGESLKKFFDAGVLVSLGGHGEMLGLDVHWEMELFNRIGFTPLQTIQIATINSARQIAVDRDLGSIEPGKLADLIVLSADPLANIHNAREIYWVMKNGVLYSGKDAARVFPDPRPMGRMYFQR